MGLRDVLNRDVKHRRQLIHESEVLVARWKAELAHLEAQRHIAHHIPLPRAGVDYSYGQPQPAALRRAGVTFVFRYLGGDPAKDLSKHEAENLSAAGLDCAVYFESTADRMLGGYNAGVTDAQQSDRQLRQIGAPSHAAVYFAADFDVQPGQLAACDEYLHGAGDHLGRARVGIYGGLRLVSHALANGRARYGVQTNAWSGGQWSSRAQVRQTAGGSVHIGGVEVDTLRALAADFGQWKV